MSKVKSRNDGCSWVWVGRIACVGHLVDAGAGHANTSGKTAGQPNSSALPIQVPLHRGETERTPFHDAPDAAYCGQINVPYAAAQYSQRSTIRAQCRSSLWSCRRARTAAI